ncbi:MAG: NAD(P)-dependent oxidoreductase [Anaerolineaceae bacterium]|nr:MAG: NAD(P)-dependent oxidoreductase [Anaerolineaceae bacterium]
MAESSDNNEEKELVETQALSVFLTDGTAPVSRALTRRLVEAGHRVTAMTDGHEGAVLVREDGGLPVFVDPTRAGEVRGMMQMSEAQVVINTAPQHANQPPFAAPDYDIDLIEAVTQAVITAAVEAGISHFVHTSFALLYGDTGGTMADEASPLSDNDDALIQAGKSAEAIVKAGGLPYCIVRAGFVYSADSAVLQATDAAVKALRPVHTGEARHLAAWITASDLADLLLRVTIDKPSGETFNGVDDVPAAPKSFVEHLISAQGVQPASPFSSLLRALLPNRSSTRLGFSTQVSNGKAKQALGWRPQFADYRAGIEDILMTWRASFRTEA